MSTLTTQAISVVVPCRNEALTIRSLLGALAGQDVPPFEVIVADGSSDDGSPAIVLGYAAEHPSLHIRLVDNPARSIPAALNLAIRHAQADIVARLDGHSLPAPDYLRQCLAVKAETGADVVGGVWEIVPGAPGAVAEAIALAVGSPLGAGDARYRLSDSAQAGPVETVPFGCFDRDVWRSVGGFDETLRANEDYAFNHAVRRAGGTVHLDPRIRSRYFARATFPALARQYWRYGWWKAHMLRRFPRSLRWRQLVPAAWCAAAAASVALAVAQMLRPVALVLWAGYLLCLVGAAAWTAANRGRWPLAPMIGAAYLLVHFCWGFGFWAGLVTSFRASARAQGGDFGASGA